jgi:hypothetical protein
MRYQMSSRAGPLFLDIGCARGYVFMLHLFMCCSSNPICILVYSRASIISLHLLFMSMSMLLLSLEHNTESDTMYKTLSTRVLR